MPLLANTKVPAGWTTNKTRSHQQETKEALPSYGKEVGHRDHFKPFANESVGKPLSVRMRVNKIKTLWPSNNDYK